MADQELNEALVPFSPEVMDSAEDYGTDAWQRRQGESIEHYRMFKYFCHMSDFPNPASENYTSVNNRGRFRTRSLHRIIKVFRKAPTLIYDLAKAYEWEKRAKSYDEYMVQREQEALEVTQYAKAQIWADRKEYLREREWTAAEKLLARAFEMLEWPMVREVIEQKTELTENGLLIKQYLIREPASWTLNDVSRFFELASKLARLAAGMSQGNSTRTLKFDFSNMADDEVERIAQGEMP